MSVETYRDPWWPRQQILNVLQFAYPDCVDHRYGGYVAQLDLEDGHVYDGRTKHLVATCRYVYNFAVGRLIAGPDWCRSAAAHGLGFLWSAHRDPERGGFDWVLDGTETADATRYCYGHAFALLATSTAARAGVPGAADRIEDAYAILDDRFWEPEHDRFRAEADADWRYSEYRGQNANMHACEAHLAAYEATGEDRYLDRAAAVARALVRDPPDETGRVWEHYTTDWEPDRDYNRDEPADRFRPWGFQPGHHAEWAKLLLWLDRHRGAAWHRERAVDLFEWATAVGWDDARGGFYYTVDPGGDPVVEEKYGWEVAEAIGAAALLAERVDETYWEWYDRLWAYARDALLNRKYGTWYQVLAPDGDPKRGRPVPRVEPGYHPVSNAFEAYRVLRE